MALGSCSKVKRTKKKIDGQWEIISYKRVNSSGLTHYYETTGTITFGEDTDSTFMYCEDYTFQGDTGPVVVQRTGIGTFVGENGLDYRLDLVLPTPTTLHECTFRLITKDDLKIEQRDNQYTYTIVLKND